MAEEEKTDNVRSIYEEEPEEGSKIPESDESEEPEAQDAEGDSDEEPEPEKTPPKKAAPSPQPQRFVPLNKFHGLMVELVGLKIEESDNRIRQAQREIEQAQKDLKVAQRDSRAAKAEAQEVADQILREMNLNSACVINVENKIVLPPQGRDFVLLRDE